MALVARKSPPRPAMTPAPDTDPGRQWERAVRALAREHGENAERVADEWAARAEARRYAGAPAEQANADAFKDVQQRLEGAQP